MKLNTFFQKGTLALTALTLVSLSSCRDQDFDWDEAHATQQYEKFTNVFIKEFGKPAAGHQWGFDNAQLAMGGDWAFGTGNTRTVLKQEANLPEGNITIGEFLGKPATITPTEHEEVYKWFSNHRVNWTKTPTYCQDGEVTRGIKNGKVYEISSNYDYGSLADDAHKKINSAVLGTFEYDENSLSMTFRNAWVQHVNSNKEKPTAQTYAFGENDLVYKLKSNQNHQCNGIDHKTDYYYKKIGNTYVRSTKDEGYPFYKYKGKIATYYYKLNEWSGSKCNEKGELLDNNKIYWADFSRGEVAGTTGIGTYYKNYEDVEKWVVKVGDNQYREVSDYNSGNYDNNNILTIQDDDSGLYINACDKSSDNFEPFTQNTTTADKMNYLCCWGYNIEGSDGQWQDHLNDFNSGNGYGYDFGKDNATGELKQNAILVTNANVKNWTYENSVGSSLPHDKYIIVYLEGRDYKGWYLGFDFESWGDNMNNRIAADGICNDWIIKIGNFGDSTPYNPARIMCEDLGGDKNSQTKPSDIDYNDIVLDVKLEDDQSVTLTLQAAGGTLPLVVCYGETPLFETHEFFQGMTWEEAKNNRESVEYNLMYNTEWNGANASKVAAKTFKLYFSNQSPDNNKKYKKLNNVDKFVFGDLHLKVYRSGVDGYKKANPTGIQEAEWVDLGNVYGSAPLKLCVPGSTLWMKERVEISEGYPGFIEWVGNPLKKFWENGEKNSSNLCGVAASE